MQSNNQATSRKATGLASTKHGLFSETSLFKIFKVVKVLNDLYDFFLIFAPESIEAWRIKRKKTLTT